MEATARYDRLLKFMYEKHNHVRNTHGYGQRVRVLVSEFERTSPNNRIGNANDKKAAIAYLLDNGWIDVVDTWGNKITDYIEAYVVGRMKPTPKGREYLQQRRIEAITKVASPLAEIIGRFFKGHGGP